ncbi:ERD7 protein, partial [Trifolium medium]|nr:ERD7 protein [Trifolium medium]
QCAAYWTTLAPNVEEYSGSAARLIASGSGHVIKGILWCGDVTMDRLQWGNQVMKKRLASGSRSTEISPQTLKRIKRGRGSHSGHYTYSGSDSGHYTYSSPQGWISSH